MDHVALKTNLPLSPLFFFFELVIKIKWNEKKKIQLKTRCYNLREKIENRQLEKKKVKNRITIRRRAMSSLMKLKPIFALTTCNSCWRLWKEVEAKSENVGVDGNLWLISSSQYVFKWVPFIWISLVQLWHTWCNRLQEMFMPFIWYRLSVLIRYLLQRNHVTKLLLYGDSSTERMNTLLKGLLDILIISRLRVWCWHLADVFLFTPFRPLRLLSLCWSSSPFNFPFNCGQGGWMRTSRKPLLYVRLL